MKFRTPLIFVALLLSVVGALSLSSPLSAQQAATPDPDYTDALWVATTSGALKVATSTGQVVLDIPDAGDVLAMAVDGERGVLWAYSQKRLSAYSFAGALLSRSAELVDEYLEPSEVGLAVRPVDGSV